ncbi:MAG TPA: hypothetical protein DDY28_07605, partial [Hyphomonas atlantica]|nr:hypothetical protein [Hyphomonas atlantica]
MKKHGFAASSFPGMHLRDEVVERLRQYGLHLTPRPLTHTAHEYYSMRYDRKADPRAPFWKRKPKTEEVMAIETADEAADFANGSYDDGFEDDVVYTSDTEDMNAPDELDAMDGDTTADEDDYSDDETDTG